jgi:CMP-N,N'-diacetyllegionaminic acid synthase
MTAIAIILGRANSKGVPGKNSLLIAGKPTISYTVEHTKHAKLLTHTFISTDGQEIANAALACNVPAKHILPRSPTLASDTATVDDAAREALMQAIDLDPSLGKVGDALPIVILYANVPIRPDGLIDRALELLISSKCDSVQSYAPVGKYHPYWMVRLDAASGQIKPWEGSILNHNVFRRQDLPPCYVPDGGIIALTRRALERRVPGATPGPHQFFGVDRRGILNRQGAVVDIDAPSDVLIAEQLLAEPS